MAPRGREESRLLAEVQALLCLKRVPGLGDRGIWELLQRHGSGQAALRAGGKQMDLWKPGGEEQAFPGGAEKLLGLCRREDIRLLTATVSPFPPSLLELSDPPALLFLKGREELIHRPGVAVVGARKATESGRRLAEALGRTLARTGVPVISGMARGIDGAAHRGALEAGGNTVAVLGSGLNVVYPRTHAPLFRRISREGLLVSEFLPPEPALPHHFPRRNRIIAALSRAVVVVEAGSRSGALITVDHALDLGREVLAFPGAVENPQARGTNRLLRDGASLLTHPEAIFEELPWLEEENGPLEPGGVPGAGDVPSDLQPLLLALREEPLGLEPLAVRSGLDAGAVVAGLTALELMGRARRCPGMRFRRV